jgi:hypothetical protein
MLAVIALSTGSSFAGAAVGLTASLGVDSIKVEITYLKIWYNTFGCPLE